MTWMLGFPGTHIRWPWSTTTKAKSHSTWFIYWLTWPYKVCQVLVVQVKSLPLTAFILSGGLAFPFTGNQCSNSSVSLYSYIIIIMSCGQHGYPWPSLSTSPYHSSPLAGLQGYILYHHIAAVCMFELVVLLLIGHMRGSTGVHHLRAHLCFSSSVQHFWFV